MMFWTNLKLMVDDTMLAHEWKSGIAKTAPEQKTLVKDAWVFPLFDRGNQIKFTTGSHGDDAGSLWSSYSKDAGSTWSERRFIATLTSAGAAISRMEFRKVSGKTLSLVLDRGAKDQVEIRFKENDLRRLATVEDLRHAPPGRRVLTSVPPDNQNPELIADSLCVGQDIAFATSTPPRGYRIGADLGLLMPDTMSGSVIHRAQSQSGTLYETRAVLTPKGGYLVMIPDGQHANAPRENANRLLCYRSDDQGKTWQGPSLAFGDEEKHHAALTLVPHGSSQIHVFETQRGAPAASAKSGRAFGFRTSDDDGHTWSAVELIQLDTGRPFGGTGVIQMTETAAGTWMAGFHHSRMLRGALQNGRRQWTEVKPSVPAQPPGSIYFLDELRVFGLAGPNVLAHARTCEGHVWEMRSTDDGRTWSEGKPTALVHPDAPPMLFYLSDHKTLIALHHNRAVMRSVHEPIHSDWLTMPTPTSGQVAQGNQFRHSLQDWVGRAEVWFSLSTDDGRTWSPSRLLFANALAETLPDANSNYQCSYVDLFTDKGLVHFIVPHRWQRTLHLAIEESALTGLSTQPQLTQLVAAKTSTKVAAAPQTVYTSTLTKDIKPTRTVVYKKVGDRELNLEIFDPAGLKPGDKRACFVAIHGGGWTSGSPRSMYAFTDHCAKLGMVAISVQYRLYKAKTPVTVFECVKDARAALRYVHAHAVELGIDPHKIIANGASAGGHLAAATAMFDGVDHADENLQISCHPDALVLFSPVIDTSSEGYGNRQNR